MTGALRFQSSRPVRGATGTACYFSAERWDFNPRAPCGARRRAAIAANINLFISILAPRAGRDVEPPTRPSGTPLFQSSRPVRGATCGTIPSPKEIVNFNPRAPCGARQRPVYGAGTHRKNFNPRAPCGARRSYISSSDYDTAFQSSRPVRGATGSRKEPYRKSRRFQSSRPVRGATGDQAVLAHDVAISILAPRAGRDLWRCKKNSMSTIGFQSSRPVRGATLSLFGLLDVRGYFNPRAPCGARQSIELLPGLSVDFNPRAPCGARR